MTFFNPDDRCLVDPRTNLRVGPPGIATFILVCFGILLVWRNYSNVKETQERKKGYTYALICLGIECVFYGMYILYYSRCRSWIGWAMYVVASIVTLVLFRFLVPREKKPESLSFMGVMMYLWALISSSSGVKKV